MFLGIRLALIVALVLLGALFSIPEVMAYSPDEDDAKDTIPTPPDDKCIDGGRTLIDCPDKRSGLVPYPPVLVGPMYANEDGFTLALVDERNPDGTMYMVTAIDELNGDTIVSDWSASRCRRFGGQALSQSVWYRFEVVARNSNGFMTKPVIRWMYYPGPNTVNRTPSDDPWLADRIDDVVTIYNLTEDARAMMSNVPVSVYRNEPGFAGYGGRITES